MCGILGVIAKPGEVIDLEGSSLLRMRDTMAARGPDDAGLFTRRNVALAHRRLAIRDPAAGHQPWVSEDRQCVLVYNGELYNDVTLRKELQAKGHVFQTRCDTEVLMAAYREWGADCVHRLRGMFAFGLYDFRDDSLLLVRDRFGIKPLFFAEVERSLVFASSIPAILEHPQFKKRPDWRAVSHYLTTFRLTLGRHTVYDGIQQLLPGEMLRLRDGHYEIERYWDYPETECETLGRQTALVQLREQLADAVRQRLVADVPVGMFLSGGVDSNVIASLVRQQSSQPMLARCGGGTEDTGGDFVHARQCAEFGRFDFDEVRVTSADYREAWSELLDAYRTPVSTPTDAVIYRMSQAMKPHVGVVLGGEGADELLCGYSVQHWSGQDFDRLRIDGEPALRQSLLRLYGRDRFESRTDYYFALNSLIPSNAKPLLFRDDIWQVAGSDEEMHATYAAQLDDPGDEPTSRRYKKLLHRVNLEGLLARLDTATMAAGLEARVPYTDHHLVESMFRVPMRWKIDAAHTGPRRPYCAAELERRGELRSKKLLRSVAEKLLPRELAHRKKASFPTPVAGWLTDDWADSVRATLLDKPIASEIFRRETLDELADNLTAAGMWLWPMANVIEWAEREFA